MGGSVGTNVVVTCGEAVVTIAVLLTGRSATLVVLPGTVGERPGSSSRSAMLPRKSAAATVPPAIHAFRCLVNLPAGTDPDAGNPVNPTLFDGPRSFMPFASDAARTRYDARSAAISCSLTVHPSSWGPRACRPQLD
ncbi:hypothetical protein Ntsu_32350 [Nocardia sp. IFM 10818]